MSFNLYTEDMNQTIFKITMDDIISVLQDNFTEKEQEKILKNLSPELITRKLDIDWYTGVESVLRFYCLNFPEEVLKNEIQS